MCPGMTQYSKVRLKQGHEEGGMPPQSFRLEHSSLYLIPHTLIPNPDLDLASNPNPNPSQPQLLVGDPPFHGESDYLTFAQILAHCEGSAVLTYPDSVTGPAADLIGRLLVREPTARLGTGEPGQDNDYRAIRVRGVEHGRRGVT